MRFLLTPHGTLVHFDVRRKAFRHESLSAAERNVVFCPEPADAFGSAPAGPQMGTVAGTLFVLDRDGVTKLFGRTATGQVQADGRLALGFDGLTLVATADGGVAPEQHDGGSRDGFWPVAKEQLDGLAFIARHRWLSDTVSNTQAHPHPVTFGGSAIHIGAAGYPIRALLGADLGGVATRKAFSLVHQAWKLERFRLYRPLICFAAFGAAAIFACLELSLQSLFEFGDWQDDILVVTDAAHRDFAQRFPEPIRSRINTRIIACRDVLDATLARYRLPSGGGLERYQPILYLDTDVLCDAPVAPALAALLRSNALCVCAEHALAAHDQWYGAALLHDDGYRPHQGERGFSTGLIGFRDIGVAAEPFARIVQSCEAFARATGDRDGFFYDQPFANYVLRKLGGFDTALLSRFSVTHGRDSPTDEIQRRGFAHLAGGVGEAAPKLWRMQRYLAGLRQLARSGAVPG